MEGNNNSNIADEFKEIISASKNISSFLMKKIKTFHLVFNKDFESLKDALEYLKEISINDNRVCAGFVDKIPAWQCVDCSKYKNSIYCFNCYQKSKDLHKNHKVFFLNSSSGMCDCGNEDFLSTFCSDHQGPYKTESEIYNFIQKSFNDQNLLNNLKIFFDDLFFNFSKFLLLTEKCSYFNSSILESFNFSKQDINLIDKMKKDFCFIFQDFLNFLNIITKENKGMLHLIATYMIKNHFNKEDDIVKTKHSCIFLENNEIIIDDNINEFHVCKCPFFRLLMINMREDIKSQKSENIEFFLSLSKNFNLRKIFCVLYFYLTDDIKNNNNKDLLREKSQFFLEDAFELIAKNENLVIYLFESMYKYLKNFLNDNKKKGEDGNFIEKDLEKLSDESFEFKKDIKYLEKPKSKQYLCKNLNVYKKFIDIICLIHKITSFKSIFPHPEFQQKGYVGNFISVEYYLLSSFDTLIYSVNVQEIDFIKELFIYMNSKILNEKLNNIKQVEDNEFSFHLPIYRAYGKLLNYFCFNYALTNNISLNEALNFAKKNFYTNEEEINIISNKIICEYLKFFAFIIGTRIGYFEYYENLSYYNHYYFKSSYFINFDFTTLKYCIALCNNENIYNLENLIDICKLDQSHYYFKYIFNSDDDYDFLYIDKNKNVIFWVRILELIISIAKNDSCLFYSLITHYCEILSIQVKNNCFGLLKANKDFDEEMNKLLKQTILYTLISKGNAMGITDLKKELNDYILDYFDDDSFNKTLDELTTNRENKQKKIYSVKDEYLKYLDMNYYVSPYTQSKAKLYIDDFKKDKLKKNNDYYFSLTNLTYEFHIKIYEKIFLNKNIEFIVSNILQKLLETKKNIELTSIKKTLLSSILNYINIFVSINNEKFLEFKLNHLPLLMNLTELLENNNNDEFFKDQINNIIHRLKNSINKYMKDGKVLYYLIEKNNLNIDYTNSDTNINDSNNNDNTKKSNDIKEKLKLKTKQKMNLFLTNISDDVKNTFITNNNIQSNNESKGQDEKEELLCFYCRNPIKLNSFENPFGKIGYLFKDNFYMNCLKITVRDEFKNYYDSINSQKDTVFNYKFPRIISCNHYFHFNCFKEGYINNEHENGFKCPLCEKIQNILIPPLILFYDKLLLLKGDKINNLFFDKQSENNKNNEDDICFLLGINTFMDDDEYEEKINEIKNIGNPDNMKMFNKVILEFLNNNTSKNLDDDDFYDEYEIFLRIIYPNYISYINFLENLLYNKGTTTFRKNQEIEIIQNLNLSLRFLVKTDKIKKNQIISYIQKIIELLSDENLLKISAIYENMSIFVYFEKLLISLAILLDYDELSKTFNLIIYKFLPFFLCGFYIKENIQRKINNNNNSIKYKIMEEFIDFCNKNDITTNCIKYILQKFLIIKLITNYSNINENEELKNIINNFNDLSIGELCELLNIEKNIFINNDKNANNLFISLLNSFNQSDPLFKFFIELRHSEILVIILAQINEFELNEENNLIDPYFFRQFSPIKFKLINLNKNIFDFIEEKQLQNCMYCNDSKRYYYICLICGEKLCHMDNCNLLEAHILVCGGKFGIFFDSQVMKAIIYNNGKIIQFDLYTNIEGLGMNKRKIGAEFNLNEEKVESIIKNFIDCDFY